VDLKLSEADAEWGALHLPPNLTLVGTVNMDESAHTFSRKVLDRAFTIELSDVTLSRWKGEGGQDLKPHTWPTKAWHPRAIRLSELKDVTQSERLSIEEVISVLEEINTILQQAQLQVGYRTRDEIGLFVLHAEPIMEAFRTEDGERVDPLDLALQMKVLPRISGGSNAIRGTVASLLSWAVSKDQSGSQADPETSLSLWREAGRPAALEGATYPRTAARLCLMWERLESEGFTSFWL
jgi:5-methylcytosine-specific restriction enzyme B